MYKNGILTFTLATVALGYISCFLFKMHDSEPRFCLLFAEIMEIDSCSLSVALCALSQIVDSTEHCSFYTEFINGDYCNGKN